MNAERLKSIIKRVVSIDEQNVVPNALNSLDGALSELQRQSNKNSLATVQQAGRSAVQAIRSTFGALSPRQRDDVSALNAGEFFSELLADEIEHFLSRLQIAQNTAREGLKALIVRRAALLDDLGRTYAALDRFGISDDELGPGETAIEVTLPRPLFNDDLQAFQRELDTLSKIVRTFYELNNLTPEILELRHISASDPILTIVAAYVVVRGIGEAVKFCLDILNSAYTLRKFVAEGRKSKMIDETIISQLEGDLDSRIETRVQDAVKAELQRYAGDPSRRNELESHALRAYRLLLQRLDHGMIVIPLIGPAGLGDQDQEVAKQAADIGVIASSLQFPKAEGEHLFKLTHNADKTDAKLQG